MPLGDSWSGWCRAQAESEFAPDSGTAARLCNFGYVRGECSRAPSDGPDAVRFSISRDRDGVVGIEWVMEKGHYPFANGPLEYVRADSTFRETPADSCLAQQARAYVSSYLRRKDESQSRERARSGIR